MTTHLPTYGYGVCHGTSSDVDKAIGGLIESLLEKAKDGWVAQGGVTHIYVNGFHVLSQAIVKLTEVQP